MCIILGQGRGTLDKPPSPNAHPPAPAGGQWPEKTGVHGEESGVCRGRAEPRRHLVISRTEPATLARDCGWPSADGEDVKAWSGRAHPKTLSNRPGFTPPHAAAASAHITSFLRSQVTSFRSAYLISALPTQADPTSRGGHLSSGDP